jgi:acyl carrier protein
LRAVHLQIINSGASGGVMKESITPASEPDVEVGVIKSIIAEQKLNAITPADIGDDDDLRGSVGVDSLDCLNILLALEQRFELQLETAQIDADTFRSVRSLAEFVAQTRRVP